MDAATPPPDRPRRTLGTAHFATGMPALLLGFLCLALSNLFDGGFLRGLFQGATIALMVLGAYLVGSGLWFSRKDEADLAEGSQWLPSRDGSGRTPADDTDRRAG